MSRLAHQLAVESEHVRGEIYEVTEFPEIARRYRVTSVPKTIVDGRTEILGARGVDELFAVMGLSDGPPVDV